MQQDPETEEPKNDDSAEDEDRYNPHLEYEQRVDEAITGVMDQD